jgi:PAS domain S-box-containing protein
MSELRRESELFSADTILDCLPTLVFTADTSGAVDFVSRGSDHRADYDPEAALGNAWQGVVHPDDRPSIEQRWSEAVAAGLPYEAELRCQVEGTYRWFLCRAAPIRNRFGQVLGYAGTLSEIDAHKAIESRLRETIALLERVSSRERLYSRISEELSGAPSLGETVEILLKAIVPEFADWMSVYLEKRDGIGYEIIGMRHWDERRRPIVEELIGTAFSTEQSATAEVLRTGKPLLLARYPEELRSQSVQPKFYDRVQALGLRSAIVVPFRHEGRIIGAIHVIRGDNPQDFAEPDLLLVEEVARRMTPALYNAEVHERERLVAQRFQEAAMPGHLPETPYLEFDAVYQAARTEATVGGDWYDVFSIDDERFIVSVGDVGGHGLPAATTMSMLRQSLRALSLTTSSPSDLMYLLRALMEKERPGEFATAFIGIMWPSSGRLQYASAGHPAPLLRLPDGTVQELLDGRRPLLGLPIPKPADIGETTIVEGSLLVLYTDGLTESTRDVLEGERALRALVASTEVGEARHPAQVIHQQMIPTGAFDDTAILTIRRVKRTPN